MTIIPGTKLGRYEIRSKLGEGGISDVCAVQLTIGVGKTVSVLNRNKAWNCSPRPYIDGSMKHLAQ